jgi:hypothetical protein
MYSKDSIWIVDRTSVDIGGHGGGEASKFARDHLLDEITKYECFWNDNDDDVLHAIKSGFLDVHFDF